MLQRPVHCPRRVKGVWIRANIVWGKGKSLNWKQRVCTERINVGLNAVEKDCFDFLNH